MGVKCEHQQRQKRKTQNLRIKQYTKEDIIRNKIIKNELNVKSLEGKVQRYSIR